MLSLEIDGHWEVQDFTNVLEACESLYYAVAIPDIAGFDEHRFYRFEPRYYQTHVEYLDEANRWRIESARRIAPPKVRLRVTRIEYASPGGIDSAGLGQATEAVDRLVGRLIDFFTGRKLRRERDRQAAIETEIQLQKLYELKLENARRLLEVRREFGDADDRSLIPMLIRDQDKLADRIAQGMITGNRKRD